MTSRWNAETYRASARQWQADADALPEGTERDVCLELARGYADLATVLEMQGSPAHVMVVLEAVPRTTLPTGPLSE